jgi:hypothetical protein
MNRTILRALGQAAWIVLLTVGADRALAQNQKTVEGVSVYMGIVPARILLDHSDEHLEREMHGGAARSTGQYHVMVALFDARTGDRITDAVVTARISGPGTMQPEKTLDPMAIANAMTYGNYFAMDAPGSYAIAIRIYRPGSGHVIGTQLEHRRW